MTGVQTCALPIFSLDGLTPRISFGLSHLRPKRLAVAAKNSPIAFESQYSESAYLGQTHLFSSSRRIETKRAMRCRASKQIRRRLDSLRYVTGAMRKNKVPWTVQSAVFLATICSEASDCVKSKVPILIDTKNLRCVRPGLVVPPSGGSS